MTHYILAGGADRQRPGFGEELAETIRSWKQGPLKILSCQFAKPENEWQSNIENWEPWFKQYFGEDTQVQLAKPEAFIDQTAWADVIFLHGGTTKQLTNLLNPFGDLESLFKDKTVVGSSAGTNVLSRTYYSPSQDLVLKGTGIVPVNTVVHYGAGDDGEVSMDEGKWARVVQDMQSIVGEEEIILLPEGRFIVREQ